MALVFPEPLYTFVRILGDPVRGQSVFEEGPHEHATLFPVSEDAEMENGSKGLRCASSDLEKNRVCFPERNKRIPGLFGDREYLHALTERLRILLCEGRCRLQLDRSVEPSGDGACTDAGPVELF